MNYDFILNGLTSHPFSIRSDSQNTTSSVSGTYGNDIINGKSSGMIMFTPNSMTPNNIIYQCSIHPAMSGTITILDQ
jgi:hypothetical protein